MTSGALDWCILHEISSSRSRKASRGPIRPILQEKSQKIGGVAAEGGKKLGFGRIKLVLFGGSRDHLGDHLGDLGDHLGDHLGVLALAEAVICDPYNAF